jgi:hypothetical protein
MNIIHMMVSTLRGLGSKRPESLTCALARDRRDRASGRKEQRHPRRRRPHRRLHTISTASPAILLQVNQVMALMANPSEIGMVTIARAPVLGVLYRLRVKPRALYHVLCDSARIANATNWVRLIRCATWFFTATMREGRYTATISPAPLTSRHWQSPILSGQA